MKERLGYLKEIKIGGRLGRLYPANEVKPHGYKIKVKNKELKRK